MKKKFFKLTFLILLIHLVSCTGYKPIYSSSNLRIEIADYTINGNKRLGNQLYSKLYNLDQSTKNKNSRESINVLIKIKKNKDATVKSNTGKILEYKISLNSNIEIKNYLNNEIILNYNKNSYSSYSVQDQFSETLKLENRAIENLINKIYQDLIIAMSEKMLK
tara:strand:+ start:8903 stop:9394 length:492 start_codon:yes stop_codon:yes gene_type:complete